MREVTHDEFWAAIGEQDCCFRIITEKHPYTSLVELKHSRKIIGKKVDSYTDGIEHQYPIETKLYLPNESNPEIS
ncbi:MAG: hypothetical protein M9949_14340 [Candidatus Kapabacteria bacterium]|nr:hypothetical protein [Candidatus Kapabacteria bacterium]